MENTMMDISFHNYIYIYGCNIQTHAHQNQSRDHDARHRTCWRIEKANSFIILTLNHTHTHTHRKKEGLCEYTNTNNNSLRHSDSSNVTLNLSEFHFSSRIDLFLEFSEIKWTIKRKIINCRKPLNGTTQLIKQTNDSEKTRIRRKTHLNTER